MDRVIRPATPGDADAICGFWNPMIRDTAVTFNPVEKTAAQVAAMITGRQADGHCFVVAEAAGVLMGFATCSQFRGGAGYATCMEHTVIVAPSGQGRGLGRALMTAVEDHARHHGAHQMIAGVTGENPNALAFHAACGYVQIARIREAGFKFDRFMDLILLQKFLT